MMMTEKIDRYCKERKEKQDASVCYASAGIRDTVFFSSTKPDQRFHSASVGKLMTGTLIFMAIEQEAVS